MSDFKIQDSKLWFPASLNVSARDSDTVEPAFGEDSVVLSGAGDRQIPADHPAVESPHVSWHNRMFEKCMIGISLGFTLLGAVGFSTPRAEAAEPPPQQAEQVIPSESPQKAGEPFIYTAAQNDSLSTISAKFPGITIQDLMEANPQLKNPHRIKPGDKITIPLSSPVSNAANAQETDPVQEKEDVTEGYKFPVARFNKETTIQTHWGTGERGGTDLFGRRGTSIMSVSDGTVRYATHSETGGYCVSIKGDDGRMYYYAHLDKKPVVRKGQKVSAGQKIGVMGDSGNAKGKGVHLHIGIGDEIRVGRGATGGCGTNFDAVTFLQQLLDAS